MEIKWWGHACFEIKNKTTVVTDPHDGSSIGIPEPKPKADLILISHDHYDHNAASTVQGNPVTISSIGNSTARGVKINGIKTYHDKSEGSQRGTNTIYKFQLNSHTLCHLGDIGHIPNKKTIQKIGDIDILFVPTGGNFTINAEEAAQTINLIKPKIAIPMHYKLPGLTVPIDGVDEFKQEIKNYSEVNNPYKLPKQLPKQTETKIIQY
ncbi:Zn-dependent hydrolase of the beta-lactamase fold [Methanonatronarchaeum thermophilum]|uniref:Zn-dependent hydrolase of the beta-lactamase fold n=1 Tax=Methanonatronarchaeum thermophilum TaxID=1927129 RepID=A0A1Y3GFK2_9EURY|nr:MBL fold metallo-hydrolase [Methanonatronarchaeum thermophilum]OUJ19073.1 Zn-dependent hydrolase of the beta-lactamase fold [Methanonatronarchaeum thermophilum]